MKSEVSASPRARFMRLYTRTPNSTDFGLVDQFFTLSTQLIVAVLIAILGIVNTLLVSVSSGGARLASSAPSAGFAPK
jgi:hypothetical protein